MNLMTVKQNTKTSEIISLSILFFMLLIGAVGASITAQLNWGVRLLYFFLTAIMLTLVVVCSIVVISRNAYFKYKWLIFLDAILFIVSINLSYSEDGIYEWHKYRFLWQTHSGQTPRWMETLASISLFASALFSFAGCALMIAWACSPKRNSAN